MAQALRLFSDFCCSRPSSHSHIFVRIFKGSVLLGCFGQVLLNCPLESCYQSGLPAACHGGPSPHVFVNMKVLSYEKKSVNSRSKKLLISHGCLNYYFFDYKLG